MTPTAWDLRPVRHVAWMLANCPTCSTIGVRARVRHLAG